jgi:DNA-binding MarR family transcriptional regulator
MNISTMANLAPETPRSAAQLGLHPTLQREVLVKTMFRSSLDGVSDIADSLAVSVPIAQELIDRARELNLIETLGSSRLDDTKELRYQLTDAGRRLAQDALSQSEYFGALPVPLLEYEKQVRRQSIRNAAVTHDDLSASFANLVIDEKMFEQLGPAVNASRSILMYGPPGNGKSSLANAICEAYHDVVYVPHFIEYGGNVIAVFDPLIHRKIKEKTEGTGTLRLTTSAHDPRYVRCYRPTVITGGELTLDMLDLSYNPVSRTYQAPLQLKSAGGVFIVDDLGRQVSSPQALVNRWIVPMEHGYDILTLQSGQKFTVPFDTKVVFSTNFPPSKIFDKAALRRIYYKIYVGNPSRDVYVRIFVSTAKRYPIEFDEDVLMYLLTQKYPTVDNEYAAFHPAFLIEQMIAACAYHGEPARMSIPLVDAAWEHLFVNDGD